MEADNKPKVTPHTDDCCGGRQSCNVKVPLDAKCSNIDEIRQEIKILVAALLTTLAVELDAFDLEIINLLDKLKCPDEVDVKVCLEVKCDDADDDKGQDKDHKD